MSKAADEFNRNDRRGQVIADTAISGLKIGGSVQTGDPEAFVRLLESSFGIVAERRGEKIRLRGAR